MKRKLNILFAIITVTLLLGVGAQSVYAQETAEPVSAMDSVKAAKTVYRTTVVFYKNGGQGTMKKQTIQSGETTKLTKNALKKTGYNFLGWNTAQDGSGKTYANRADVSKLASKANNGKTIKLYAQWGLTAPKIKKVTSPSPSYVSVTYEKNTKAYGYKIQYSTSKKFPESKTESMFLGKNTTSIKLLDIVPNKTCYVRMRSYYLWNDWLPTYGEWGSIKSVKVKSGSTIMNTSCYKAIEADVKLTGSGTGYHVKFVIGNGTSAVSYGIQYDQYAQSPYAGKAVTLIENIDHNSAGGQTYTRPSSKALKKNQTYHLMMTVDKKGKGAVYLDYKKIGTFYQPGLASNEYWNYARLEASGRLNGDKVDATFSNIKFKVSDKADVRFYGDNQLNFKSNKEAKLYPNAGLKRTTSMKNGTVRLYGTLKGVNGDWDSDYDNVSQYALFEWYDENK